MKVFKRMLVKLYGIENIRLRRMITRIVCGLEGDEFFSETLREIFARYHGVKVGMYSHGGCFQPWQFDRHTEVGRYCSIAMTARTFNRNHPMNFKSMHAFFFNEKFSYAKENSVEYIPLTIGHDVWMGHNAMILPNVRSIGTGAVIGAGAVVNKNVPPYAVVVGNPARIVRFRFSKEVIDDLLASRWWEKPIEELANEIPSFMIDLENEQAFVPQMHSDGFRDED